MRSWVFVSLGLAGAATLAALLYAANQGPQPPAPPADDPGAATTPWAAAAAPRSVELARTRRAYDLAALDAFVVAQRTRCDGPDATAADWRVLAEALLERCLTRDAHLGMKIGTPVHATLPEVTRSDLKAAEAALEEATARGDTHGDHGRVLAAVLSYQITGAFSLLSLQSRIDAALKQAREADPDNPRLLVTFGCQKLFAPAYLGHDPTGALPFFERAARVLQIDERPALFAAMACHLLERADDRDRWLATAAERNPRNAFVRAVRARLAAGEEAPFARDLDADER